MANEDFKSKVQSAYQQFTKAEKKVADYILENPKKVLFMSISDLADACNVGDTSVFRFCRTMKLQGYQEFKIQLSLSMRDKEEDDTSLSAIDSKDSFSVLSQKVLQNNVSAINETFDLLNAEEITKALNYFEQAEQVYFFGVGASMVTALAATNKFLRITPKVHCMVDSHMQTMLSSMLSEKDLAIIVSYSGATKDTIHIAKLAKESGAKVICITRHAKSPLTTYSDVTILCGANEGPLEGGSTSAQMSQLFLIDILFTEYYKHIYQVSNTNNKKTSVAVIDKLY